MESTVMSDVRDCITDEIETLVRTGIKTGDQANCLAVLVGEKMLLPGLSGAMASFLLHAIDAWMARECSSETPFEYHGVTGLEIPCVMRAFELYTDLLCGNSLALYDGVTHRAPAMLQ